MTDQTKTASEIHGRRASIPDVFMLAMKRFVASIAIAALPLACTAKRSSQFSPSVSGTAPIATPASRPVFHNWAGVYATPGEIGGFAGTVLVLQFRPDLSGSYQMSCYSDMEQSDTIRQPSQVGDFLIQDDALYLPEASGIMREGKPELRASVDRYTLVKINDQEVLMRDDALQAFKQNNRLYDYGILVRVGDLPKGGLVDLANVVHPSIKLLYSDPAKPWVDPFVHGPNER